MPTIDPRVDAYIAKSAEFAQPVLLHLRAVIHAACPDVEETIKWSMPHFDYKGIMCGMAAFKGHCALHFWHGELLIANAEEKAREAMGHYGRITSIKDLPSKKELTATIKAAMKLNDAGTKSPARAKASAPKAALVVPEYFQAALSGHASALAHFDAFTPGKKREYIDWLQDAKTETTRLKRLEQALEWIGEGKVRHWKYANC